jgi:hypothetical protein
LSFVIGQKRKNRLTAYDTYLHDKISCAFSPLWRLPFLSSATEKEAKECRPSTQAFILESENKSAFFTPDFCGCCGTHES